MWSGPSECFDSEAAVEVLGAQAARPAEAAAAPDILRKSLLSIVSDVLLAAVDPYRAYRAHGAEVFTRSASDAQFFVDDGDLPTGAVGHHPYRAHRAVADAVSAVDALALEAVAMVDVGHAPAERKLFEFGERLDSAGGAHGRAGITLGAAVAVGIAHRGLEQMFQVGRGLKDAVGAVRHAELAARTTLVETFHAHGPGRDQRHLALRVFLRDDGTQPAVELSLRLEPGQGHSAREHCRLRDK